MSCNLGEELKDDNRCLKCERGTYRSKEFFYCQNCTAGFTTEDEGAKEIIECNIRECSYFVVIIYKSV